MTNKTPGQEDIELNELSPVDKKRQELTQQIHELERKLAYWISRTTSLKTKLEEVNPAFNKLTAELIEHSENIKRLSPTQHEAKEAEYKRLDKIKYPLDAEVRAIQRTKIKPYQEQLKALIAERNELDTVLELSTQFSNIFVRRSRAIDIPREPEQPSAEIRRQSI